MYKHFIKRMIDLLISLIAFMILSPVLLVTAICLFIANRGKPFFIQRRPGKNEKIFSIVKFKTMNDKRDAEGNLLSDAERLTPIGKFVRRTSLDEIPQLLNVIKGDMSLIGPRPLLVEYLPLYNEQQRKRHEVRPGITGWAQVNGRNAIDWNTKFELDIWYINHLSFVTDCKVFFITIKKIFKPEGVSQKGHATMEMFNGNN